MWSANRMSSCWCSNIPIYLDGLANSKWITTMNEKTKDALHPNASLGLSPACNTRHLTNVQLTFTNPHAIKKVYPDGTVEFQRGQVTESVNNAQPLDSALLHKWWKGANCGWYKDMVRKRLQRTGKCCQGDHEQNKTYVNWGSWKGFTRVRKGLTHAISPRNQK